MSIEGQGHFFTIYFQVLYVLCLSRPRYQVSVYRTTGRLVIKYWLTIILCHENKYIKHIYNMMLQDMKGVPGKENWAASVKQLLGTYMFVSNLYLICF